MNSSFFCFFLFVGLSYCASDVETQLNCSRNFDVNDEVEDEKYLEFMDELEKFTFGLIDDCPNNEILDLMIWDYRFALYEIYKDDIVICQCLDSDTEFLACMGSIRDAMKVDVISKRKELEERYCTPDDTFDYAMY